MDIKRLESIRRMCGERLCKEWFMRTSVANCFERMVYVLNGRERRLRRDMAILFILSTVISLAGTTIFYLRGRNQ